LDDDDGDGSNTNLLNIVTNKTVQSELLISNENTNTNDHLNENMLLDVDNVPNETQGNDMNQHHLSTDRPILHTISGIRVLSTSGSSNDEENPNQDSNDNGI